MTNHNRGETKLAVLDCQTMELKGYEGRHHCQTAVLGIDEDTDPDYIREAVEDFRASSDVEQEKQERIIKQAQEPWRKIVESIQS